MQSPPTPIILIQPLAGVLVIVVYHFLLPPSHSSTTSSKQRAITCQQGLSRHATRDIACCAMACHAIPSRSGLDASFTAWNAEIEGCMYRTRGTNWKLKYSTSSLNTKYNIYNLITTCLPHSVHAWLVFQACCDKAHSLHRTRCASYDRTREMETTVLWRGMPIHGWLRKFCSDTTCSAGYFIVGSTTTV